MIRCRSRSGATLFSGRVGETRRLAAVEPVTHLEQQRQFFLHLLVAAFGLFLGAVDALLHGLQVGEVEFGLDHLDVAQRIDGAVDVDDVLVLEAAHDMGNRIDLADMAEKLVAQPFPWLAPLTRPAMSTNSITVGRMRCGWTIVGQSIEARVGDTNDTDIRLDGAEWIVGRLGPGRGDGVEDGRLANVGQADDAALNSHFVRFP